MKRPPELAAIIERDHKIATRLLIILLIAVAFFIIYSRTGGHYSPQNFTQDAMDITQN